MREYFTLPDSETAVSHNLTTNEFTELSPNTSQENELFLDAFEDNFFSTYKDLREKYENHVHKRFAMARRAILCNFSLHDNEPDIDTDGMMHPEFVMCPMRCECRLGFCALKRRTALTEREIEYIKLAASGKSYEQIADELDRSQFTVQTMFRNIYARLNFHGKTAKAQLIMYCKNNQLI